MTNAKATKKLTATAKAEIGYLEKASNKDLYSKTGNAGSGNYTKYWAEVYPPYQGQPWCACFVSWCFMETFGLDYAKKLLKHWPFVYCPTLAAMTTNKTPKPGSVVLFYKNGAYAHTGIVIAVTSTSITTIEGNTSNGTSVIPNGGAVCQKTYALSSLSGMTKYFVPDYKIVKVKDTETTDKTDPSGQETHDAEPQPTLSGDEPIVPVNTGGYLNSTPVALGRVTASSLNVRTWAGTEYPQIKSYPVLERGTIVDICDAITDSNAQVWYYVRIGGKWYGFVCGKYIEKV